MHKRYQKGFTIVEIATVIFVIAILATITIVVYNTVQKQARDSARRATVSIIANAAEHYYRQHGEYPYGSAINPTGAMGALPNYDGVRSVMPGLTDQILSAGNYGFFAYNCTSTCSATTAQLAAKRNQYIYFSPNKGASGSYLRYTSGNGMWGCEIIASDTDPGFAIAWRNEENNQWLFVRSKFGTISISNFSTGPIAPTTCTFTTL